MKKLTSSPSIVTINHYKNVLESEGIPSQIRNEFRFNKVSGVTSPTIDPSLTLQ